MIDLTTDPDIGYGRERTKKAVWRGETDADGKTLQFELAVSHDGGRKRFSAYVKRSLSSPAHHGFTVNQYQPFRDIERLPATPCARYSAKALDAAFDSALADLALVRTDPRITRLLVRED